MPKFKDTSDYESKQSERAKRAVSGVSSLNAKDYLGQSSTLLSFISLMSSFFAPNFEEFFKEVASKNYKDITELGSSIDKILFEKDIFKKFLYLLLAVYINYLKDLVPKFEEKFKPIKIPLKEFESKFYRNEVGAPSESIFDASKIDSIKILYYFMLYLTKFGQEVSIFYKVETNCHLTKCKIRSILLYCLAIVKLSVGLEQSKLMPVEERVAPMKQEASRSIAWSGLR